MAFNSLLFVFLFLPSFLVAYFVFKPKKIVLLVFSILFYAWGDIRNIPIVFLLLIVNYLAAVLLEKQKGKRRKAYLLLSIIIDVGVLFYYKYVLFLLTIIGELFKTQIALKTDLSGIVAPIGLSFLIFKLLAYVIDVYEGENKAELNIINYSTFVLAYNTMLAGPIVRYKDIIEQIEKPNIQLKNIEIGIHRFCLGLFKKVVVAGVLSNCVDYAFLHIGLSGALSWLGAVCYMIQIYCDFSGYSDMAIGLGYIMGMTIKENFDYPYMATSIQKFWKSWHISLTSWFRDYIYIPLGGNRKGEIRTYINILIVFLATGIWHGANWTFIIWGIYHGILSCIERVVKKRFSFRIPIFLKRCITLYLVLIGWVVFRAESLTDAGLMIASMHTPHFFNWRAILPVVNKELILIGILGIVFCVGKEINRKVNNNVVINITAIFGFILSILYCQGNGFSPFIYFNF